MENWIEKPLNYWGDFKKGGLFSKADIDLSGNNFCIHYGELFTKYNEVIYDVISKTNKKNGIISKSGDILFPASDVTPFGLGKASTILKENVVLGGDMHIFSPNKDVDSVFLSYQINLFKNEIIRLVTGSAVKHSKSKDIGLMPTLVPLSIIEQQKIAKILTTLDNTIKKTEQLITKYKNIKQGLMHDLLNYGIDENGTIRNPQTHTFVEKKGLVVPEEWHISYIGKSSYLKGRIGWQGLKASEFIEEGPFLVTGTDIQNGRVQWDNCYHVSEARYNEADKIQLKNDDLLITKDGTIGKVAIVRDCPKQAVLNSGLFLLRCIDESYSHLFLFYILRSQIFLNFLANNQGGSTIKHLYQKVFENFPFPTPTISEQNKITNILEQQDNLIESEQTNLAKLQNLKQGLMADLLTGKVRVELKEIHNYV